MRRVDDELLAKDEQASELSRFEDCGLPVLPRDDKTNFRGCPLPIGALREGRIEGEFLPRVQDEPSAGS